MRRSLGFFLALILFASCSGDASIPTEVRRQSAANGGGRSTISVNSTDPTVTRRDTTLNVRVLGFGFTPGANVSFAINGVISTRMKVNSTSYVSGTELIANVTVAPDADTVKYDVITLMADGKKGIGTDLLEVITQDPPATWYLPVGDASVNVLGDGGFVSNGYSMYQNNVCGTNTRVFVSGLATEGDATIQTDNTRLKSTSKGCAVYPRKLTFVYPDGVRESSTFFANLHEIARKDFIIPIGTTITRPMNIRAGTRCGTIRFRTVLNDGTHIGADSLNVTRVDAQTYSVSSRPAPNNKGSCDNNGQLYNMNVRLTIVSRDPLP